METPDRRAPADQPKHKTPAKLRPEINRLGRTIWNWRHQISNWHAARVTNAPTEAANNLVKRVKRGAFGFTNFANYRIRALLYAGKPNWALLDTLTPTRNAKSRPKGLALASRRASAGLLRTVFDGDPVVNPGAMGVSPGPEAVSSATGTSVPCRDTRWWAGTRVCSPWRASS